MSKLSFPIQTKLPAKNNKYYNTKSVGGYSHCIKGKPTQSGLNVLDNCVGWACGRFNEIYSYLSGYKGMKYYQLNCNAEDFIYRGKKIGLKSQTLPIAGGIMVWEGKGKAAGHVEVVEQRKSETNVITSSSGYNSYAFMNRNRLKGNGNWGADNKKYKYLGCLINPAMPQDSIDFTKEMQKDMNKQWNCGLKEDGVWGKGTETACSKHHLYLGVNAKTMNRWLQERLNYYGFKVEIDSSFGYDTQAKVKLFQKKYGLKVDGVVGPKTYKALTE